MPNHNKYIYLLIKTFSDESHANDLLYKGVLHCKTLQFFKDYELPDGRADKYEGVSANFQPDDISIKISFSLPNGDSQEVRLTKDDLAAPVVFQADKYNNYTIFCAHAIMIDSFVYRCDTEVEKQKAKSEIDSLLAEAVHLDDANLNFGQYAIVIKDVKEFIRRIHKAVRESGLSIKYRHVEYYNHEEFHGEIPEEDIPFMKRKEFSFQKEFRFIFSPVSAGDHRNLVVGDLSDIALKIPTSEIRSSLRLQLNTGD